MRIRLGSARLSRSPKFWVPLSPPTTMAATRTEDGGDRILRTFQFLETKKDLLTNCTSLFKTAFDHFSSLEQTVLKKHQTLDSKLKNLDSETLKTLESLEQRDTSIPDLENAAIGRIHRLKEAALAEFEKPSAENLSLREALRSLCRKMDSGALWRFLVVNRKELAVLRAELAPAISEEALDPLRFALDVVEDFLSPKESKAGISDKRWACGVLLREMFPSGGPKQGVASSVAERAGEVAEKWKEKIDDKEGGGGVGPAEAQMFLQFVVGYGIGARFTEEFLRDLLVRFPTRKDMAKLAAEVGFKDKMEGIIDELIKSEKELEAVYFAYDSGLMRRYPPVPLIEAYQRTVKKKANTILKNGNYSLAATEEACNLELNSLRSIVKCVEDHMLQSEFILDNVRKRLSQLERSKADKKRKTNSKPDNKRMRGNSGGGNSFPPAKAGRLSVRWGRPAMHSHSASTYAGSNKFPNHGVYEAPSASSYVSQYGGAQGQNPTAFAPQQSFPREDMSGARSAGSYVGPPTGYGGYNYGAVPQPTLQPPYPQ